MEVCLPLRQHGLHPGGLGQFVLAGRLGSRQTVQAPPTQTSQHPHQAERDEQLDEGEAFLGVDGNFFTYLAKFAFQRIIGIKPSMNGGYHCGVG